MSAARQLTLEANQNPFVFEKQLLFVYWCHYFYNFNALFAIPCYFSNSSQFYPIVFRLTSSIRREEKEVFSPSMFLTEAVKLGISSF